MKVSDIKEHLDLSTYKSKIQQFSPHTSHSGKNLNSLDEDLKNLKGLNVLSELYK